MDPTVNLEEQLDLVGRMLSKHSEHLDVGEAIRLAELVNELNYWIITGGFLPKSWQTARGGKL